jgi:hypothetical protein
LYSSLLHPSDLRLQLPAFGSILHSAISQLYFDVATLSHVIADIAAMSLSLWAQVPFESIRAITIVANVSQRYRYIASIYNPQAMLQRYRI